jgi:hypothetical protein
MTEFLKLQNFAEFLADLCALQAPLAPITPFYSVENIATPAFSSRLLAEGLFCSPEIGESMFRMNGLGIYRSAFIKEVLRVRNGVFSSMPRATPVD